MKYAKVDSPAYGWGACGESEERRRCRRTSSYFPMGPGRTEAPDRSSVSNIYKRFRAARVSFDNATDPSAQVTMYDPGLGTDIGATAFSAPVRFVQKLLASVEGRGITTNIADCYDFVISHYEPGDRIFLFGFSRGAYTVRSVADLLRPKPPHPTLRSLR